MIYIILKLKGKHMVPCQSRAKTAKHHAGWAAALGPRRRNRKCWVWILLLNQGTTHYNDCHSLAIRLTSPSSLVQAAGVSARAVSLTGSPAGRGGLRRSTTNTWGDLPLLPQPARMVTQHYGFTCLPFTTALVKGGDLLF